MVQSELGAAQKRHAARLDAVAQNFSDLGLAEDAAACRALSSPMQTTLFRISKPPKDVQPEISLSLPEKERDLRLSFRKIEDHYANELDILRKALRAGYPNYAFQILLEVIRQNPDQAIARKILGYKLRGKEWVTPFANEQMEKGNRLGRHVRLAAEGPSARSTRRASGTARPLDVGRSGGRNLP